MLGDVDGDGFYILSIAFDRASALKHHLYVTRLLAQVPSHERPPPHPFHCLTTVSDGLMLMSLVLRFHRCLATDVRGIHDRKSRLSRQS